MEWVHRYIIGALSGAVVLFLALLGYVRGAHAAAEAVQDDLNAYKLKMAEEGITRASIERLTEEIKDLGRKIDSLPCGRCQYPED